MLPLPPRILHSVCFSLRSKPGTGLHLSPLSLLDLRRRRKRARALAGAQAPPPLPAMKTRSSFRLVALLTLVLFVAMSMKIQYENLKMGTRQQSFESTKRHRRNKIDGLPRGAVESTSDMELKPLSGSSSRKDSNGNYTALLAMAVGISQKQNVDILVCKFIIDNCSVILFHYDGNVDGWRDLEWSDKAIHILAHNQTKWWFAKRFLHPDVVSAYDYIFLWDEDLGVENFHLARYLQIMASEGLEISQPALDPDQSSDIHHRITVRDRKAKVHRRVYDFRGSLNCSNESTGPPCTGWVEGMAPVFSRAAWKCVWHLIQNDLIHGWGLDMKLGYCAQGDRTKKVGVIDTEYIVHQGIPSLGGGSVNKVPSKSLDLRAHIRRQSTAELEKFKERWDQAVREDKEWLDPFEGYTRIKG